MTVPDEEQMGQLTVYKEGHFFTDAEITENGQIINPLKYLTDYIKGW